MKITRLADDLTISGQIGPADVGELHAAGVGLLLNLRPDGEAPGQLLAAEAARLADGLRIAYRQIPVTIPTISPDDVEQFGRALSQGPGPVHAYCGSGLRVALLWGLHQVVSGAMTRGQAAERVAAAGLSFAPGLAWLDRHAPGA